MQVVSSVPAGLGMHLFRLDRLVQLWHISIGLPASYRHSGLLDTVGRLTAHDRPVEMVCCNGQESEALYFGTSLACALPA